MLKLGFNAYAKNDFHEHPSQISIASVLQAKATNWKTNYVETQHGNTTWEHKEQKHYYNFFITPWS